MIERKENTNQNDLYRHLRISFEIIIIFQLINIIS